MNVNNSWEVQYKNKIYCAYDIILYKNFIQITRYIQSHTFPGYTFMPPILGGIFPSVNLENVIAFATGLKH